MLAEVAVRIGEIRLQANCFANFDNGAVQVAFMPQQDAEARVCLREVWLQLQCFSIFGLRGLRIPLVAEHTS